MKYVCVCAGYSSLNEGAHTPMYAAGRSSLGAGSPGPGAPSGAPSPGGALPPELSSPSADAADGKLAPRCWRTVYLLLDLYANMPDAETITHRYVLNKFWKLNLTCFAI